MEKLLSLVIPAYNEEENIAHTAAVVRDILTAAEIPYEIVFINDGSKDHTWEAIVAAAEADPTVKGVCFSRNFGKESAMFAGLYHAQGACCVIMDCDLQHPPEKIVEMYRLWEQGYEVVEAVKADRGRESFAYKVSAKCFYGLISHATGIDMMRASDFKLLDRKAMNVLLNMQEKKAFFRALSSWIGFRTTQVEFEVQERAAGQSKWSPKSLIKYALSNLTSFSTAPMQIVTVLGVVMLVFSLVLGISTLYNKIVGAAAVGFTTVIMVQLFTGSVLMISIGIIGYYIACIYEEIKQRPRFIVEETVGDVPDKPPVG